MMYNQNFFWWFGTVEDREDPMMLGRVRVRIKGYHTIDPIELPTEMLPWAHPIQPIGSASIGGIGDSPTGIVVGSNVFGFFADGEDGQQPVVMGTFGGWNEVENPLAEHPRLSYMFQQDTNKAARGETTAIHLAKSMTLDPVIGEPDSPFAPEYPYNKVTETEGGHMFEVDDTPGAERLHEYHTSGTFTEVHPDGTRVHKVVSDDYQIVHGDRNVHIKGDLNIIVDGNMNLTVGASKTEEIGSNWSVNTGGFTKITPAGTYTEISGGNTTIKAPKVFIN